MSKQKRTHPHKVEIRYASQNYPNALYGVYDSQRTAQVEAEKFFNNCLKHNENKIADLIRIISAKNY